MKLAPIILSYKKETANKSSVWWIFTGNCIMIISCSVWSDSIGKKGKCGPWSRNGREEIKTHKKRKVFNQSIIYTTSKKGY